MCVGAHSNACMTAWCLDQHAQPQKQSIDHPIDPCPRNNHHGRTLAVVVRMRSCSIREVTMLRSIAQRCAEVRPSLR